MYIIDKINELSILNHEYKFMFYDLVRTITIQLIAQLLFSMNNPSIQLFNSTFIQTSLYLCVGVISFWLVVYKYLLSQKLKEISI